MPVPGRAVPGRVEAAVTGRAVLAGRERAVTGREEAAVGGREQAVGGREPPTDAPPAAADRLADRPLR